MARNVGGGASCVDVLPGVCAMAGSSAKAHTTMVATAMAYHLRRPPYNAPMCRIGDIMRSMCFNYNNICAAPSWTLQQLECLFDGGFDFQCRVGIVQAVEGFLALGAGKAEHNQSSECFVVIGGVRSGLLY